MSDKPKGPKKTQGVPLLDRDKLLKSIIKISAFLTSPTRLDEILKNILDEVVDTIGFDRGIIRLFDETKQYLEAKVVKNYSREEAQRAFSVALNLSLHDCIATKVARLGEPIAVEDASTDPRISDYDRFLTKIQDHGSYFCSPLKIADEVIGIIAVWSHKETRFYREEINLFLAFAKHISIIIHSTRLFEKNAEKIRQMTLLQEGVSEMNQNYSLDNHLHNILVTRAKDIARADRALVYFWDIEKDRCLRNDGEQIRIEDKRALDHETERSIIRPAIENNEIVTRQGEYAYLSPIFPELKQDLAIPLSIKDKFKGALYLARATGGYSRELINIIDILVTNAATSYDNAIMHSLLSLEAQTLKSEVKKLKEREDILLGFHNIIGKSEKMRQIFHLVEKVADHNTSILIQGESGTGKELIARAIHRQSNRNMKPFVSINCAAIPGNLLESELFGYEAGAFTDARKRKIGIIDSANGGTFLLDEIGDMSIHLQAKFLRVLEEGSLRRLGGTENIPIDVRFIFSTNKELSRLVTEGSFREDLFYRISVVPITIPPLRERPEDITSLVQHYLEEFNKKFKKKIRGLSYDAGFMLYNYPWPGNVRELKNIVERIMILKTDGTTILADDLPAEITARKSSIPINLREAGRLIEVPPTGLDFSRVTQEITAEIKGKIISDALDKARGNKTKAAKLLGISRYKLIREQKKKAPG